MDENIEKYKELYTRSKEVFLEDLQRFYRIDEKASKYVTVLTFLAGVYGLLCKKIFSDFHQSAGLLEWLLLLNGVISFILIVGAWVAVFRVLQVHAIIKMSFNQEVIDFHDKNTLIDIYYAQSKENALSIQSNRVLVDNKSEKLYVAYRFIEAAMISFVVLGFICGAHILLNQESKPLAMEVFIMSQDENAVPKDSVQNTPVVKPTSQAPNPNVQAPKNEFITEGYDPAKAGTPIKKVVVPIFEKGVVPTDKDKK